MPSYLGKKSDSKGWQQVMMAHTKGLALDITSISRRPGGGRLETTRLV